MRGNAIHRTPIVLEIAARSERLVGQLRLADQRRGLLAAKASFGHRSGRARGASVSLTVIEAIEGRESAEVASQRGGADAGAVSGVRFRADPRGSDRALRRARAASPDVERCGGALKLRDLSRRVVPRMMQMRALAGRDGVRADRPSTLRLGVWKGGDLKGPCGFAVWTSNYRLERLVIDKVPPIWRRARAAQARR